MAYIKKLVMYGFKSFPRKTEIPFTPEINVVLGPNGSGKSNITDALCFVLGRLSIKSMRAVKSPNLIFMGTKEISPAKEAAVEIIFDNSDKTFSINENEISLKRIVRRNGQSTYKINGETKTRQEILTLLSQAGIDPYGFNIIMQGEIHNFVRMHNEERRKIIEEVSGISIYESRKEKSLNELEKTEEKLKEVLAILRERTAYLNNLEKEREQALKFKKLEEEIKKLKASIIFFDLNLKKKNKENILSEIENKSKEIEKVRAKILSAQASIKNFEEKISFINSSIQKSTGLEQEKLNQEIANLRAELAGAEVKLENFENKILSISKQKQELKEIIRNNELSVKELQKESPTIAKKQKEIEEKKKELEQLGEERKKFYMIKSELKIIRERFGDKKSLIYSYTNESESLLKQINFLSEKLYDKKTTKEKVEELKKNLDKKNELLDSINNREREIEKISFFNDSEIERQNKLIEKISKMEICPMCKNKITGDHIKHIWEEIMPKLESMKKESSDFAKESAEISSKKSLLDKEIESLYLEISKREEDLAKLLNIEDKKEQIKALQEKLEETNKSLAEVEKRKNYLEKNFDENSGIEKKYETALVEIQEISQRNEETLDSDISFKQKELERSKILLKQLDREEEDYSEEKIELKKTISLKENSLEKKRKQEEELTKKFQEMIKERDSYQSKIRELEYGLSEQKNIIHNFEQETNNFKIDLARVGAEIENLEIEFSVFNNIEIIKSGRDFLVERLNRNQEIILKIGPVNLRSLEVYDSVKKEYDSVKEKVDIISNEKNGILKIIHEIDIKKKKTFLNTLEQLNIIFSKNFAQISAKGEVYLELENKKEPFEGGVGITIKIGHGKYFDVTSLSGGEQTIVALSLIFAIQELNPYCFYILDEIDAALDKRNSERLAGLLQKYMQKGQYIVITHNDEIIMKASNLYGVSMHDGISKIISMKV